MYLSISNHYYSRDELGFLSRLKGRSSQKERSAYTRRILAVEDRKLQLTYSATKFATTNKGKAPIDARWHPVVSTNLGK